MVWCFETDGTRNNALLRHVALTDENQRLWIADESFPEDSREDVLRISWYEPKLRQPEMKLPMNLGRDLEVARDAVTQAAEEFFTS